MFVGHFAAGFVAKKYIPETQLAVLFVACQLLDLLWPVAMVLGLEQAAHNHSVPTFNALDLIYVPYSHSLGMSLIWSVLFAGLVKIFSGSSRSAVILGLVVFSHWILDFITHIPDLPVWFDGPRLGLGLWQSRWATFIVEAGMFGAAIFVYIRATSPFHRMRLIVFSTLVFFLSVIYIMHVFGPKPPESHSPATVAGPAFAMWLLVFWAYFADKKSKA